MARWFLYFAPGYLDEAELLDDEIPAHRQRLVDHGTSPRFLEEARPGDVEALYKRDRWVIRFGRVFSDDDEGGSWT
jgi:hypothetical protein